ncbi:MAG: phosphatidate cytidylyltransferase, partial [Oscillospiraceae bacterium]|nr:phosphatidate cytidylyltransferase [Oscillospiraceae bacterium]
VIGDLSASVIKRQKGIKDYGNIMPGHGGLMDRFDSVLFVVPAYSVFLTLFPII